MDTFFPVFGILLYIVLLVGALGWGFWITLRVIRAWEQVGQAFEDIAGALTRGRIEIRLDPPNPAPPNLAPPERT